MSKIKEIFIFFLLLCVIIDLKILVFDVFGHYFDDFPAKHENLFIINGGKRNMKKVLLIIGGIAAVSAIVAGVLLILKKVRMSLTIETNENDFDFEDENDDILVSIEDEETEE